jgi:hypothetical protein
MGRMSPLFTWRSAIVTSDLPPQVRLVALALSLHMNERGGSCFPSQKTLAAETGLGDRQVRRHISTLRKSQWLMISYKERPSGRRAFYTATVPIEAELRAVDNHGHEGDPPVTDDLWDEVTHDL